MPSTSTTTETKCFHCGEELPTTKLHSVNYNGCRRMICGDCIDEDFIFCEDCGHLVKRERAEEIHDGWYCQDCASSNFTECQCGELIRTDDAQEGCDGNLYCEDCYSERFSTCEACHRTCWSDSMVMQEETDDQEERWVCERCANSCPRIIHQYSYKPTPIFNKLKHESNLYMGFELEVETNDGDRKAFELQKYMKELGVDKHYYFKYDGSVTGFEIVTHPFTLGYLNEKMKFRDILNWLRRNKCKSFKSGNCGFHVHVSANFFEDYDIAKLRGLFVTWKPMLHDFSIRKDKLHFCQFENVWKKEWFTQSVFTDNERYRAINLCNSATVEFRLFRGTLDHKRLLASMQFCDAISNYVKQIGVNHTAGLRGRDRGWTEFLEWGKREGKYHHFIEYIEKH